jgi:hypothetical protein
MTRLIRSDPRCRPRGLREDTAGFIQQDVKKPLVCWHCIQHANDKLDMRTRVHQPLVDEAARARICDKSKISISGRMLFSRIF